MAQWIGSFSFFFLTSKRRFCHQQDETGFNLYDSATHLSPSGSLAKCDKLTSNGVRS